jgi:hypothetical protein
MRPGPLDWTNGEDKAMAEYRGEGRFDRPDGEPCPVCAALLAHVGPGEWECLSCIEATNATNAMPETPSSRP